jgi:F-type H+-transporting ATPase subunit b
MEEREKNIQNNLALAELKQKEAGETALKTLEIRKELESKKAEMIESARLSVEESKKRLLDDARKQADRKLQKWLDEIKEKEARFMENIQFKAESYVCGVASKAVKDLADEDLSLQIIIVFIERLTALDEEKNAELTEILNTTEKSPEVQSSFEIPLKFKKEIQEILKQKYLYGGPVDFVVLPDAPCGIVLSTNEYKLSWSLEDYISGFENELREAFASGEAKIPKEMEGSTNG